MHRIKFKHLLVLSSTLSLVVIFLRLLPLGTCRLSSFVFRELLYGSLFVVLLVVILVSSLYLWRRFIENRLAILPFIISVVTLLVVLIVPSGSIVRDLIFRSRLNEYNEVVHLVQQGSIRTKNTHSNRVLLPPEYSHLSNCGGEILVDTHDDITRVFFFTDYQPGWNSFGGYLYRLDGKPAQPGDFSLADWGCEEQQQEGWFFCIHYD